MRRTRSVGNDETPTADAMKRLIERADGDKLRKAKERLACQSDSRTSCILEPPPLRQPFRLQSGQLTG